MSTYTPPPYSFTGWLALRKAANFASDNEMRARLTTNKPALDGDEIAVKMTVKIPRSAFTTPQLEVTIDVPEQSVVHPEVTVEEVED